MSLIHLSKGIYKSSIEIDNKKIVYSITISRHVYEDRYISIAKGTEPRMIEYFNIKKFDYIVRPHIKKMIKKPGKYVIMIPYKPTDAEMLYLLVAFEPSRTKKGEWFCILVTTYRDRKLNLKFIKIPLENRLLSQYSYKELLNKPELMDKDEKREYDKK